MLCRDESATLPISLSVGENRTYRHYSSISSINYIHGDIHRTLLLPRPSNYQQPLTVVDPRSFQLRLSLSVVLSPFRPSTSSKRSVASNHRTWPTYATRYVTQIIAVEYKLGCGEDTHDGWSRCLLLLLLPPVLWPAYASGSASAINVWKELPLKTDGGGRNLHCRVGALNCLNVSKWNNTAINSGTSRERERRALPVSYIYT